MEGVCSSGVGCTVLDLQRPPMSPWANGDFESSGGRCSGSRAHGVLAVKQSEMITIAHRANDF